jgi:enoyl-[acyl-carrier protein] reductase III
VPWALITGASGDIGKALCKRLASDGYDIALHTFRNVERAQRLAAELERTGRRTQVIKAHLGRQGATAELVGDALQACGQIEVVVSNAASGVLRPVTELDERSFDWCMSVNARPLVTAAVELRPRAVVALTSPGSGRVLPAYSAVGASKAALEALVRYLAVELAPETRVNAVSAGVVNTSALSHFPDRAALLEDGLARTPAGRLVTPEDVANAVAWLVSQEAAMVNGHTLVLDGGWSLCA